MLGCPRVSKNFTVTNDRIDYAKFSKKSFLKYVTINQ